MTVPTVLVTVSTVLVTVPTVLVRRAIVIVKFTCVIDQCFANRPVAGGGEVGGCRSGCGGSGVEGGQSDPRVTVGGDCGSSLIAIVRDAFDVVLSDVITTGITAPSDVISASVSTPADVICAGVMLLSDIVDHVHSVSSADVTTAGDINPVKYDTLVNTSADAVCLDDVILHASCYWLVKMSTHVVSPADVICLADVIIPADVIVST